MNARSALILLAVLSAGCAATAQRDWRPAKFGAANWHFEGQEGAFGKLTISINGQPALVGSVSVWSGAGELSGTYEGHTVKATCDKPRNSDSRTECSISVDGEKAATLNFKVK